MPGAERKAWSSDVTTIIKTEQVVEEGVRLLSELAAAAGPGEQEVVTSEMEREAERILREAREKAETHLRDAGQRLQALEEEAYERGWERGRDDGHREGRRSLVEVSERLEKQLIQAAEREAKRWEHLASELVPVVLEAVEKVLRREFRDEETALHLIKEGLKRFSDVSDITLIVSPEDMEDTLERRSELEDVIPPRTELILLTDEGLGPGEFRLQGQEGVFEGTVSDLIASLRGRLREGRVSGEDRDGP